ncbi:MAG TPA: DUF1080 domain-containing protein [archaeon]|nr:DUF1080 domain-containing protein [archaeon]
MLNNPLKVPVSGMLVFFLALVFNIAAASDCPGESEEGDQGYLELITKDNGGNYTKLGWNHCLDGYFTIDTNTGILTSHGGGGLLWYSLRKFRNFVLELDYMTEMETTNSGIFLRIPNLPSTEDFIHESFEIQILDSTRGGMLHTTGAIYDAEPPKKTASYGPGKWNHFKITCQGLHFIVELNSVVVNDWIAEPRGKVFTHWPEGYIGVQNHEGGGSIKFRNIRIKEL